MSDFPDSLLDGYRSFRDHRYEPERARYRALAEHGQTPEVMVIACCDSRSAPETIFHAAPGEIFVVRNVANLVPPYEPEGPHQSTSAALEFAVQSLRVRHIVVLGHGRCGGIRAALHPEAEPLSPGDFIGKWMTLLGPAAREVATGAGAPAAGGRRRSGRPRSNAPRSATRSRTCGASPASRSSRTAAGSTCTAPGSTSRTASSGRWTRRPETSPRRSEPPPVQCPGRKGFASEAGKFTFWVWRFREMRTRTRIVAR